MKGKILKILENSHELTLSGEKLSDMLGVSRVTIWKHIKKLQELGYGIEPSGSGYRLNSIPDALYPWEFPRWEEKIHYEAAMDSTMTVAKQIAGKGCSHFTVVVADRQNAGRGRLNRRWHAAEGGFISLLYCAHRLHRL